jgi:general L-amino acid transport system permease protein
MTTQVSQPPKMPAPNWVNVHHPSPEGKPPATEVGLLGWLRVNLFSSTLNSIMTIVTLVALYFIVTGLARWIVDAYWQPVWANRKVFAVGLYPTSQLWQPATVLMAVSLLFGLSAGRWGSIMRNLGIGLGALFGTLALLPIGPQAQVTMAIALLLLVGGYFAGLRLPISSRILVFAWILSLPFTLVMLRGTMPLPLTGSMLVLAPAVDPNLWGGIMLTLLISVVGIVASFPLGVLLALGRRSKLPVVKAFCIAYIEIIRGVPLITLLFMGMTLLPLFLPTTWGTPPGLLRVITAVTLFSAAYLAENVRGGLQAIPSGQYEAAHALGLSTIDTLRLIILPQAITKVIPAIVGQFIGLFKDTSLASLVGLFELVGVAKSVINQPEWLGVPGGVAREVYLFAAIVFFIFSFGMSTASRRLEERLDVDRR